MKYSYTDENENRLLYDKRRRINIMMPDGLVFDIDDYCRRIHCSRSAFIAMACERTLPYDARTRDG